MRNFTFLAVFLMAVLSLGFHGASHAQLLLNENFDYPAGDLLTAHGWIAHSGAGSLPITVTPASITYTGYQSSGIGNEASLVASGEDVHIDFTPVNTGSVYASFIVNVSAVNTTGDYFFHMGEGPWNTYFKCRLFTITDASNNLAFGIAFTSAGVTPPQYTDFIYSLNTTYLLVVKYTFVDGGDDFVDLFINPVIGASEPIANKTSVGVGSDALNIGAVALRQGTNCPAVKIDGIRVGLTWNDVVGAGSIAGPTIQASNLTFSNVLQTQMDVAWTNGDGTKRIAVINTINSFTNPVDGNDPVANPVYSGSGEQVVYNNNGNSVGVAGLTGGTNYWFRAYEYNGTGSTTKFLNTTATLNPNNQTTATSAVAPTITAPTYASITNVSAMLGGDITSDGGSPITERGTVWKTTPGVSITDNKLAEGSTTVGVFSHLRSGLTPKTQIYFKAYATNVVGTSLTSEASFFTLANEPISHVSGFAAESSGFTNINLTWTSSATGADGYIILQKTGATPPSGIPADATGYTIGSALGDGTVAALVTPGSALTKSISGLYPSTQYSFTIIPFAWDGVNFQTYNYYTDPTIPSATATTQTPPATTYTWIGEDNAPWTTPANWNPTRSVPANNDILQFNGGGSKTVTSVPTETIAKLVLANNTILSLQAAVAGMITISGSADADLVIPAGCALNLNAINAITLAIGPGATGSISGNMTFSATEATGHRLIGVDAGAITFNSGATFTAGIFFSGNAFGSATSVPVASANSVIFASGSTYVYQAGSNPFALSSPASVVVFQTGSLFKAVSSGTPSFSGRTYANFEMDAPGIILITSGGNPVSIDNFTITNGTFNFNMVGTSGHSIKGNITVAAGSTLNFAPATAGTVSLNGTTEQTISGAGSILTQATSTLEIANNAGVVLNTLLIMNGNLQLTNGLFTLGSNVLFLGATSAISGTPSAAAMIVATGAGEVRKSLSGVGSFTFPVGDNTVTAEYSPVTLNFTSGTFPADNYVGVNLVNAKYPADPNTASYLNRYWNISQSAITGFTCNATFQYVQADVNGTESQIYCVQVIPTPFISFDAANPALHQLTANGLSGFGTFTGTQLPPTVITYAATLLGGTYATLNGSVNANNQTTAVSFEYGLTTAYGSNIAGVPSTVTGNTVTDISSAIWGLTENTTYHFRIKGVNAAGTTYGNDMTFQTLCPLPAAAGTIIGPGSVCTGATGVIYQVPVILNATSYTWTVPAGATITSGSTNDTIIVTFGPNPVAGIITVYGTNSCGNGAVSPNFNVTVNAVPTAPLVTFSGAVLTSSAPTGNQWYLEGSGAISGATGQTYTAIVNGWYWSVVTLNGCSSPESNHVHIVTIGQQELETSSFKVYPVPNHGIFTVSLACSAPETVTIQVFNQVGSKIYELNDIIVKGVTEKQIDLRPAANGVYSIVFITKDHKVVRKVMVNK